MRESERERKRGREGESLEGGGVWWKVRCSRACKCEVCASVCVCEEQGWEGERVVNSSSGGISGRCRV